MVYAVLLRQSFAHLKLKQLIFTLLLMLLCKGTVCAIPLTNYRGNIEQTIAALDTVNVPEEQESLEEYQTRFAGTLSSIRVLLPLRQNVEWREASYSVDHTWLHQHLDEFEKASPVARTSLLARTQDRLKALSERLLEIEETSAGDFNKAESKRKLEDILSRSEYAKKAAEGSALTRLWARFLRWLSSILPRPKPMQPGSAYRITTIAQIFVVVLSLAVLAFVLKAFAPKFRRSRGANKKRKQQPRVILGERLEPEQSAGDLLAEAEGLVRQGEIRAAIRKAYIGLLVELGDRKIISLAQHKTNRDYLRALRERQLLHGKMVRLTDSYERHWYGLAKATESDWLDFRARYREALQE
jgi:hypothetical protein